MKMLKRLLLQKKTYWSKKKDEIEDLIEKGVNFFLRLFPRKKFWKASGDRRWFGVRETKGEVSYKGLRISEQFFSGEMLELFDYQVDFQNVELKQGCMIHAYSLMDYYSEDYVGELPSMN
jgi:hypothetical protein